MTAERKKSSALPALALNLFEKAEVINFIVSHKLKYILPVNNFAK